MMAPLSSPPSSASPHLADERLDDFVDGLLDDAAHESARAHVAACASCATRLDELRTLLALSAAERRAVQPPAELWPRVMTSIVDAPCHRQAVLRSIRVPLAAAAVVLVTLSSATTVWVMSRVGAGRAGAPPVAAYLKDDAKLDRALAARDHEHGPVAPARIAELRARLAAADAAVRGAPDDEALYRALAERARVLNEIRPVLGLAPSAPRPPGAPVPAS